MQWRRHSDNNIYNNQSYRWYHCSFLCPPATCCLCAKTLAYTCLSQVDPFHLQCRNFAPPKKKSAKDNNMSPRILSEESDLLEIRFISATNEVNYIWDVGAGGNPLSVHLLGRVSVDMDMSTRCTCKLNFIVCGRCSSVRLYQRRSWRLTRRRTLYSPAATSTVCRKRFWRYVYFIDIAYLIPQLPELCILTLKCVQLSAKEIMALVRKF